MERLSHSPLGRLVKVIFGPHEGAYGKCIEINGNLAKIALHVTASSQFSASRLTVNRSDIKTID